MNPKVSVVIPTHFRLDLVETILNHLNQQTYPIDQFEVIIVSTGDDGTSEWVEKNKQKYLFSLSHFHVPEDETEGKDVSAKRTYGATQAKGEWLAFLDNDMQPEPDWLIEASRFFDEESIGGIEGQTLIPQIDRPTLTYKGLLRVVNPGGYQSCNIFFRKSDFFATEGYSKEFPWYLEDTDAAWSILDLKKEIIFAGKAKATHPVPPAAPWRLLHEAKGAVLKPKLYKRHKEIYREKKMKILRKSHYAYLFCYLGILSALLLQIVPLLSSFLILLMTLVVLHGMKMFYGCKTTLKEVFQTLGYTLMAPPVIFFQGLRGGIQQGLSWQEVLFLLKP